MTGDLTPKQLNGVASELHKRNGLDAQPQTADDEVISTSDAVHGRAGKTGNGKAGFLPGFLRSVLHHNGAGENGQKGALSAMNGAPPNGKPPIHQRWRDRDFRQILSKGLKDARRGMVVVGIFSFWVNFLILAIPILPVQHL